jgi:hypothetical protein
MLSARLRGDGATNREELGGLLLGHTTARGRQHDAGRLSGWSGGPPGQR